MVTKRKQLRNRKKLHNRIFLLGAIFLISSLIGYLISLKLFTKTGYISPLATLGVTETVSPDEQDLTEVKELLQKEQIEVKEVKFEEHSYKIKLKDDSEVILSSEKSLKSQISSLQFILSRLTMEGKLFSQLDLRFDKPVIKLRQ